MLRTSARSVTVQVGPVKPASASTKGRTSKACLLRASVEVRRVAPVLPRPGARLAPRRLGAVREQPQRRQVALGSRPQGPPVPELASAVQRQREGGGTVRGPLQPGRQVGDHVVVHLSVKGEREVPSGAAGPAQPVRPGQPAQRGHLVGEGGGDVLGGSTAANSLMPVSLPGEHVYVRACPGHRAYRCTARLASGAAGRSATMTVLDDRIEMAEESTS
ncbi:hypothetical protein SANTM175S_01490 [Streptomyces antimycoticus]